jgi:hypothetical protein
LVISSKEIRDYYEVAFVGPEISTFVFFSLSSWRDVINVNESVLS